MRRRMVATSCGNARNYISTLVPLDAQGRVVTRTEQVGSKVDPESVAAVRKTLAN